MKYVLKNALRIFGIKIAVSFITVCMMIAFVWLFDFKFGFIIYSIFTSLMLSAWLFSEGNRAGRKIHAKDKGPYLGFLCGAVAEIPSFVLMVLLLAVKSIFLPLNISYWVYNAAFMGFLNYTGKLMMMTGINVFYIIPLVVVPIAFGAGYYLGFNRIETDFKLAEKLIYKDKR